MKTKDAVDNAIRVLLYSGKKREIKKWQGEDVTDGATMLELENIFLTMLVSLEVIAYESGADLPWAEDHFQERLDGASNPGKTYKYWPYAKDLSKYLEDGKFSHTYQERFWDTPGASIDDIVSRLMQDNTTRQAFFSIWRPTDQINKGVRVPCSLGYWFKISEGRLNCTYLLRSCDARRHFRNDVYMAQRLMQTVLHKLNNIIRAEHTDHKVLPYIGVGELSMWIGSFHCFESDVYSLKKKI